LKVKKTSPAAVYFKYHRYHTYNISCCILIPKPYVTTASNGEKIFSKSTLAYPHIDTTTTALVAAML